MLITKKRINSIDKYIAPFKHEEGLYVATEISSDEFAKRLKEVGFPESDFTGIKLVPKAIGPITQFNTEGRDELLKDLPMETFYRDACIKDWHGDYQYVDIPGKRYQRKHIEAPCQEISLITIGGKYYAISDYLPNTPNGKELMKLADFMLDSRVIQHEPLGFHDYNCLQMNAFAVVSDSGTLPEESSFFTSVGHPFPAICIRTSTERPEALDKACFFIAGIDEVSLLQAVDTAVTMNQNGDYGIPVPDYVEENVSTKVVKIIQSYVGIVNKMVWRK